MIRSPITFRATTFAFLLFLILKTIYVGGSGIPDTDFFWHLAYGEWILRHHALPAGDTFSWTFQGVPYQLTQWLGEVTIGLAYQVAGYDGTLGLSVILAGLTIFFAWRAAAHHVHTSVALTLVMMSNTIQIMLPARPQMFSFMLTAVTMWCLTMWDSTGRRRYLALLVPTMAVWPCLHGGFVVGLLLIGLYITGKAWATGNRLLLSSRALIPPVSALLLATMATGLNPYGYQVLVKVVEIGHLQSSNVIAEWQPINLTSGLGWCYLLFAMPLVGFLIMGMRIRREWIPIAAFALIFGYLANRQVAIAGAICAPILAMMIADAPDYASRLPTFRNPSRPMAFTVILASAVLAIVYQHQRPDLYSRMIAAVHPVAAADYVLRKKLGDRLYADTLEASYLIHRGIPVSIDGRMDLYGDKFFFDHYLTQHGGPGWAQYLAKLRPSAMLVRQETAICQLVEASGLWKRVFEDDRYVVLAPADSQFPTVVAKPTTLLDGNGHFLRAYRP